MTISRNILIVSRDGDLHAKSVIAVLQTMGHRTICLDLADVPLQSTLTFSFDSAHWEGTIPSSSRVIELSEIDATWWRKPLPYKLPPDMSEEEQTFARMELEATLHGMWESLDCYWMNFPAAIRRASLKPAQLKRASRLGFEVPRTIITTDPDQVRAFYEQCNGQIIYKVLTDPMLGAARRIHKLHQECIVGFGPKQEPIADRSQLKYKATYTTLIQAAQIERLEAVRLAPCQFQEYIPKRLELRVTVVGNDLFTAEIHSQEHERTRVDWRHYDVRIPYRKCSLPVDVAERCLALTRGYNLNYSAIDLILTPDGRYVFLEINPNGQWLWIQQLVPELKIKEAIAAQLSRGTIPAV